MKKMIKILVCSFLLFAGNTKANDVVDKLNSITQQTAIIREQLISSLGQEQYNNFLNEVSSYGQNITSEQLNTTLDKYLSETQKATFLNEINVVLPIFTSLKQDDFSEEVKALFINNGQDEPNYTAGSNCDKEGLKLCLLLALSRKEQCEYNVTMSMISLGLAVGVSATPLVGTVVGVCGIIIGDGQCETEYNLSVLKCNHDYCPTISGGGSGGGSGSGGPSKGGENNGDPTPPGPPGGGYKPNTGDNY